MRNIVVKSSSWNPGARFLLLFNNPDLRMDAADYNGTDIVSKIFDLMYHRFNAARVVILYATGIKTYNVYITNPYKDQKDCRKDAILANVMVHSYFIYRNIKTYFD